MENRSLNHGPFFSPPHTKSVKAALNQKSGKTSLPCTVYGMEEGSAGHKRCLTESSIRLGQGPLAGSYVPSINLI